MNSACQKNQHIIVFLSFYVLIETGLIISNEILHTHYYSFITHVNHPLRLFYLLSTLYSIRTARVLKSNYFYFCCVDCYLIRNILNIETHENM